MATFKYTLIDNSIIDAIPIVIDSIGNDNENSVKSPKLGGTKFNVCSTCNLTRENGDMGHPGRTPLRDICIAKSGCIKNVLDTLNKLKLCNSCLMVKNNTLFSAIIEKYNNKYNNDLKKEILLLLKNNRQGGIKCNNENCQNITGTYKYNQKKSYFFVKKQKDEIILNKTIYTMLIGIPDIIYRCVTPIYSDSILQPYKAFYANNIIIPVLPSRPPNYFDNKESHVMTTKLGQLVGISQKSRDESEVQKIYNDIDNVKPNSPYKTSNMLVTLNIQVGGNKKGSIVRSNIMARRSDNTSRCVAGPAMDRIGYIYIPRIVAKTLTSSIYYNRFTENMIKDMLINNNDKIKYILLYRYDQLKPTTLLKIKPQSRINNLLKMKYGDRIEVELEDNDIILFSRQPSLHKFNIQAGICKIWDNNTIATPTPIANSMNLDYDGDEMNVYKLKSSVSVESLFTMLSVNMIKNNYNFSPIFGLIQDQIIAVHMIYNIKEFSLQDVIYILGEYSYYIRDINKKTYTGKELLSLLFPDNLTYDGMFKNGEIILQNISSKQVVAQSYESFSNILSQLKNNIYAVYFIDVILYVARKFINLRSFSVSLKDIIPDIYFIDDIQEYVNNCCKIIQYVASKYYIKKDHIIKLTYDEMENIRIQNGNNIISSVKNKINDLFKNEKLNAIMMMKNSGYKITIDELVTVLGCTGQQGIDSDDIPKPGIMGRVFDSTLPSSLDIESLGFVKSSILKGLTFKELGFHMKYNAITKILKITCETSSSGTIGRKLVKFMEGVKVDHLGRSVLNNDVVWYNTNHIKMTGGDISKVEILNPSLQMINYIEIKEMYDKNKKYLLNNFCTEINREFIFPINIKLEIQSFYSKDNTPISSKDALKIIDDFIEYIYINIYFCNIDITWFKYILYTYLDRNTVEKYNKIYSEELILYVINKIKLKLLNSLNPGYPIGLEYANNIQEKFTQQSLSSFHTTKKSGTASTQLGFSDFKDTVELSKKKRDIVTAFTIHRYKLEEIKKQMEYLCLKNLNPQIIVLEEADSDMVISVTIKKYYINEKISLYHYLQMYIEYLENNKIIKGFWIRMKLNNDDVSVIFGVKIKIPYTINKIYMIKSIPVSVSKGKINNINLEIEDVKIYNNNLEEQKGYRLKFYIDSITDLINFDTRDIHLELGPWFTYNSFGIQFAEYSIRRRLVVSTKEKSMEICYIILSKLMCLSSEMYNIKKIREGKQNVIKSAIHGTSDAITTASYNNVIDPNNDIYSQILSSQIIKLGHGYYECFLNLNRYDSININSVTEQDINIKSEIIENF
ncbi:RNA polymerase RPO147 [Choristoneura rosaceana entomopoxvirus 'L']|uniref:DNA-directed RNA polymerase 147 kDa polypeptide n=1 Tax=Choristoneura rosaceana entomopoxvirus 'L' TaxID=1293539 RepID=A0ABM9QKS6_9POXV|nr:RNA polymerase RPO147 [Choristoneura rosaceana entomopoxvirus 'L']CCU56124.1 RNA polymerase RPO147 [Choristoneura rosaceana entomopoxvirus 'L']